MFLPHEISWGVVIDCRFASGTGPVINTGLSVCELLEPFLSIYYTNRFLAVRTIQLFRSPSWFFGVRKEMV